MAAVLALAAGLACGGELDAAEHADGTDAPADFVSDHHVETDYVPECRSVVANPFVVTAADCSYVEVAAAVQSAVEAGGGTVCLPACVSEWWEEPIGMPTGIGLVGAGVDATILRSHAYRIFNINERGSSAEPFRITGIRFEGYDSAAGTTVHNIIRFESVQDFRIDHCHLTGCRYCIAADSRAGSPHSTGVIDHNVIERGASDYESVYCVSVGPRPWLEDMGLGSGDAVFIEDNILSRCGHPAATFGGGHYVFRHNAVVDSSSLDGHGPGFESTGRGTRAVEVYGNEFVHHEDPGEGNNGRGWTAIGLRAGGGVIFDNTFRFHSYGVRFSIDTGTVGRTRGAPCSGCAEGDCWAAGDTCFVDAPDCYRYDAGAYACSGCEDGCHRLAETYAYPSLDQVHDMWIWNNTHDDVTYGDTVYLYANDAENMILEDRDYHRREPSVAADGFAYVPFAYPHPLVTD